MKQNKKEIRFECKPNTGENATPLIRRTLEELRKSETESTRLHFRPGRYDFFTEGAASCDYPISNHDQQITRPVIFDLNNLHDVTIDGNGSQFVFHGHLLPFALVDSKRCKLKNFSIDSALPALVHQFRVVRSKDGEIVCEVFPPEPWEIRDGRLLFTGTDLQPNSFMICKPDGRLRYRTAFNFFNPASVNVAENGTLCFHGLKGNCCEGDYLILRSSAAQTCGILLWHADDAQLHNITLHYSDGMGLVAQMTENIELEGFRVARRSSNDPRRFTTRADATHFSGCRGRIVSRHGFYEGMGDDAINVHGTYLKVTAQLDEHTVMARYVHERAWGFDWGYAGDLVQFVDSSSMAPKGQSMVIASISADAKQRQFTIRFTEIVPENDDAVLENLTWTPEVEFSYNVVRNNRGRGALFTTPRRVLVENNTFDHVLGSGILLCGDAAKWFESGGCRDVIIRKNRFINALRAHLEFSEAVISICSAHPALGSDTYVHSGIDIYENVIETFDQPWLYAKSVRDLRFHNNEIWQNRDYPPFHPNHSHIRLEHVAEPEIFNNRYLNCCSTYPPTENFSMNNQLRKGQKKLLEKT